MEHFAPTMAGIVVLGTVLGFVIRGWSSVRDALQSMVGFLVLRAHLEDEMTATAVLAHLIRNYRRYQGGEKTYSGRYDSFRDGRYGHIPYEQMAGKTLLFWNGCKPFWFCVEVVKSDDKGSVIYWGAKPKQTARASIVFVRGSVDVEGIIRKASQERNELFWNNADEGNKRFFLKKIPDHKEEGFQKFSAGTRLEWYNEGVYRLLSHEPSQLGRALATGGKPASDLLYFPPHVTRLIEEVRAWRNLQSWYLERGIPWKRGWCLYGPPGTGKTALVRAIAEDLDMPLFVYSLGHMVDNELERSWSEMQAHVPCVALIEDFDTVFHGRENVYGKPTVGDLLKAATLPNQQANQQQGENQSLMTGRLSFGCLLNCIDGVDKMGGIFTVFTTNHIDKLDPALGVPRRNADGSVELISTRPGRIDKAIELGYMENEDKMKLARRIFFDDPHGLEVMLQSIRREPERKETPAQFQERCAQLALEALWGRKNPPASEVVRRRPARELVN